MGHLTGLRLTVALSRTTKRIELRNADGETLLPALPPEQVTMYLDRGYEAHGTGHRVRYLCPPKPKMFVDRRLFDIDTSFSDGRACIKFWADQRSAGGQILGLDGLPA